MLKICKICGWLFKRIPHQMIIRGDNASLEGDVETMESHKRSDRKMVEKKRFIVFVER
jgi:hypothetical protein